jgi:hypothetical protein
VFRRAFLGVVFVDPINLPENLDDLDEGGVVALGDAIKSRLRYLAGQPLTREIVDEMRDLRAGLDAVNTRAAAIEDEQAAMEAEAAAALEGIDSVDPPSAGPDDDPDADADPEPEVVIPDDPSTIDDTPAPADPEQVTELEPVGAAQAAAPAVPFGSRNAIDALRRRQNTQPAARAAAPAPSAPARPSFGFTAAGPIQLGRGQTMAPGAQFETPEHFAETVVALRDRMGRTTMSGRSFEYVGHADTLDLSGRIDADPFSNYAALQTAATPDDALVASGNLCPPDNPIYDFFRLAVPQSPVEASLPTVAAPRGGVRYIATPDFRAARAAIGTRTTAQNADPETPDKPCSRAVCPTIAEAYVTAVSECVRWDNLAYRAFPELVANYMADVAVNFASVKECLYLTAIHSASTAVTAATPTYGALRALAFQLRAAASGYRKRQNMDRNATLLWYAPNWMPDMLLADAANDHSLGLQQLRDGGEAWLGSVFANLNIRPIWFNDQANCNATPASDSQAWRTAQGAGALNLWPTGPITYLHAPGEFIRLDAGSLDVGLVRDSALNGTNDLELFAEQWTGVVHLGLEAIRITHTLCPDGTAPNAVAELSCA